MQKLLLLALSCTALTAVANVYANPAYTSWDIAHTSDLIIYGNYTTEWVSYYIGVDALINKSHLPADTISINCAGTEVKLEAGHAIACKLPPESQVSWVVAPEDFHNGSQGMQGKYKP